MRFFAPLAVFGLVATSLAAPTSTIQKRQTAADVDALASQLQTALTPYSSELSAAASSMPADSSDPLSALTLQLAHVLEAAVTGTDEVQTAGGLLSASDLAQLLSPVLSALESGLDEVAAGIRSAMSGGSAADKRDMAALEDMTLILRKDTLTDYYNAKKPAEQNIGWIMKRQSLPISIVQLNELLGEITSLISPLFNQITDLLESLDLPPL